MKKFFLTTALLLLYWILSPSFLFAATCDINTAGQCGASGGCSLGQKCTYDIQGNYYCSADNSCPTTNPDICPINSDADCLQTVSMETFPGSGQYQNVTVGQPIGTSCPTTGYTCQHQGTPYTDSQKCVCTYTALTPTPTNNTSTSPVSATSPSPLPTIKPIESTGQNCTTLGKNTVYPPNSSCYAEVKKVEANISKYPLTCIVAPEVTYKAEILNEVPPTETTVSVTSDLSAVTLGFLGPDSQTLSSVNPDQIAKKYLFNGLFDRPSYSKNNIPRELFRTYWRMLNSRVQANIKAIYLSATRSQDTKLTFFYLDKKLEQQETDTAILYSELPSCLRRYPVCDDYANKYNSLSGDVRTRYDTLLPFDFNNNRGYITLPGNISKESIPYLSAILHALEGQNGLLSFYSPDWMIKTTPDYATIPISMESTLYSSISAKDLLSTCVISKNTSASAPKTYPVSASLTQKVTIPLKSELISSTPNHCYSTGNDLPRCRNVSCSLYDNNPERCLLNEERGCCYFVEGTTKYELTGKATGRHATVFNNPLINSVNDLIVGKDGQDQSAFYHMLLPSFTPKVEKTIISSPSVQVTTNDSNTTVTNNGTSTVYRENALAQNAMQSLQNCWLVPSDQQTSSKCGASKPSVGECSLSEEPLTGTCSKSGFGPYVKGTPYIMSVPNVSPEVAAVYAEAEKQTGVSCVALAAVHFMEGGNNACQSLISGRKIGEPEPDKGGKIYTTLLETAIDAANELKAKGAANGNWEDLITAFSNYNGGGNSNCRSDPPASDYGHCPAQFSGEDDPYAMSWYDQNHASMFLRCPRDGYCGASIPFNRPGAYTVALSYYLSLP